MKILQVPIVSPRAALVVPAVVGLSIVLAGPAQAARYGLVVGINAYHAPLPRLTGAVNDAEDIAAALDRSGALKVVTLVDEQATRAAITGAWSAMVAVAGAGDTIIFSFAGHGSQEPAGPGDNDETDQLNENFLLVDYAPTGPGVAERLVDNDVARMLAEARDKGVHVIFVADSCHSGTMFRSVGLPLHFRSPPTLTIDAAALAAFAPPLPDAAEDFGASDPITFLAAVPDGRLDPEIMIDGKPRGGLSWAFARALEGAADRNRDGRVTEQELTTYIRTAVQQVSDSQQITQSFPIRSRAIEVLDAVGISAAATTGSEAADQVLLAATGQAVAAMSLRLAYRKAASEPVEGAEIVPDADSADLVYDGEARTVEKRVAGVVAEDVAPTELPSIVAKWRAIAYLKAIAARSLVPFSTVGDPRTYRLGERVTVQLDGAPKPFMTLFNLPPKGRVEFLYPTNADERDANWRDKPFVLPLVVRDPPFGSEHLVAVLSDEPLDALQTDLAGLTGDDAASALPDILARALEGKPVAIGIADVFTSGGR